MGWDIFLWKAFISSSSFLTLNPLKADWMRTAASAKSLSFRSGSSSTSTGISFRVFLGKLGLFLNSLTTSSSLLSTLSLLLGLEVWRFALESSIIICSLYSFSLSTLNFFIASCSARALLLIWNKMSSFSLMHSLTTVLTVSVLLRAIFLLISLSM